MVGGPVVKEVTAQDCRVVIDVNVVVDLALELSGVRTGHRRALESLLGTLGEVTVWRGESVRLRPILSSHIVTTARSVLRRGRGAQEAEVLLRAAVRNIHLRGGIYDDTREDYYVLAARARDFFGTDAEDEAVLACAQRCHAAVLTEDREFRQYLADRHVQCWGLEAFCLVAA